MQMNFYLLRKKCKKLCKIVIHHSCGDPSSDTQMYKKLGLICTLFLCIACSLFGLDTTMVFVIHMHILPFLSELNAFNFLHRIILYINMWNHQQEVFNVKDFCSAKNKFSVCVSFYNNHTKLFT